MAKLNCTCGKPKDDCCPFRKIVIPAVMGDDSEDSPSAPKNGAYRNALVEYESNGAMYMYASDGIFTKLSMVAGSAGMATVAYVDQQDAKTLVNAKTYTDQQDTKTLADAKAYADSIAPTVDVTKAYVDQQDANILAEAKAYTDEHAGEGGVSQDYVDQHDTATLSSAKSYTDTEVANTLQNAKDYADGIGDTTLASANAAIFTAITQANVPVITLSNTDISEGSALPANNFYGVYIEGSE